ncbi:ferritin-like domain-containing protein [Cohnella thermotolerans]|uniref:ferritin-like domain-containing protein n=1 Tax=Cohnella thermotolerans TaxID=329858 RepID=UPI00041B05B2|nr:ferritin-like domain-containing protein [Cohnella thermotolerans]
MYWSAPVYGYRQTFQPVWATTYAHALDMIKEAVQGERHDELFYDDMIKLAPTQEQKKIIASIRDDERGHNRMFRSMYRELTGQDIPLAAEEPYEKPRSYLSGLVTALFGELAAVERYRTIWSALPPGVYKDTVLGILMDEQKHATKYNYLYALNK